MNLGQLIGELRIRADERAAGISLDPARGKFIPYKNGDGHPLGRNQRQVLEHLDATLTPQSAGQIARGTGMTTWPAASAPR